MLPFNLSANAEASYHDDEIIFDLGGIRQQFLRLRHEIPGLDIRFAVKSCPVDEVLQTLAEAGAGFDAASIAEIKQALSVGGNIQRIHYGNTIKSDRQIAEARKLGIRDFAADSLDEIRAIADCAPGSKVFCRLATDGNGAVYGLSRKFGSSTSSLIENLAYAKSLGLIAAGISVHIGSQQMSAGAWQTLFEKLTEITRALHKLDIHPEYINLGGGLPANGYSDKSGLPLKPNLDAIFNAIRQGMVSLQQQAGQPLRFILEPGRFLVADYGVIRAHVLRLSRRIQPEGDEQFWLFLSCGRFNGLYETDALRYQMIFPGHDSHNTVPCVVAGPTCDSDDILNDENNLIQVPRSLKSGDTVWLLSCGAYSTSYTTVGFNGFKPLRRSFLRDDAFTVDATERAEIGESISGAVAGIRWMTSQDRLTEKSR